MPATLFKLQPEHKLLQASQFKVVFDNPQFKLHSPAYTALVKCRSVSLLLDTPETSRLGLVVAKKKIKRAHERNRVKRIIRDQFRLNKHLFSAVDIVFIVKAEAQLMANDAIHAALQQSWQQLIKKQTVVTASATRTSA